MFVFGFVIAPRLKKVLFNFKMSYHYECTIVCYFVVDLTEKTINAVDVKVFVHLFARNRLGRAFTIRA